MEKTDLLTALKEIDRKIGALEEEREKLGAHYKKRFPTELDGFTEELKEFVRRKFGGLLKNYFCYLVRHDLDTYCWYAIKDYKEGINISNIRENCYVGGVFSREEVERWLSKIKCRGPFMVEVK